MLFFQFFNSPVALKNKKNFASPRLEVTPLGRGPLGCGGRYVEGLATRVQAGWPELGTVVIKEGKIPTDWSGVGYMNVYKGKV